jgi:hypothetical protein
MFEDLSNVLLIFGVSTSVESHRKNLTSIWISMHPDNRSQTQTTTHIHSGEE